MDRQRGAWSRVAALVGATVGVAVSPATAGPAGDDRPPNVILMVADDLGWGELGCYGQERIRTPNLDRLASEGLRFTQAYAGAPVCAPSRCVLLTGRHSGRAEIRGNREVGGWGPDEPEGQWPITPGAVTIAELLAERGYATGAVGKWGLGGPGSTGHPCFQGFDLFYGYLCQRVAHNYHPTHLWWNHDVDVLGNASFPAHERVATAPAGYDRFRGPVYAPDRMVDRALAFIAAHRNEPFFLYVPFVEPHLAMQPPDAWVEAYPEAWDETPYLGDRGYLPHPRPRAGYAAMISDLDEHVGRIVAHVDELGLGPRTLVLFTSDNGPTHDVGGVDTEFFRSAGPLRGRKGSLHEGGIRVPLLARWPGVVAAGTVSEHVCAFQDVLPTLVAVAGGPAPADTDGLSFLPTLTGAGAQPVHETLVWEFHGYGGQKAVRMGRWKAIQGGIRRGETTIRLYDLDADVGEQRDVAAEHPALVERARRIFREDRTPCPAFPLPPYDEPDRPSAR